MALNLNVERPYSSDTETTAVVLTVGTPVETDNGSGTDFVDIPFSVNLDPAAVTVVGVTFVTGADTVVAAPGTFSDLRPGMPVSSTSAYVTPSTVVSVSSDGSTVQFADPAAADVTEDLTGDFASGDYGVFVLRVAVAPVNSQLRVTATLASLEAEANLVPLTTPVVDLINATPRKEEASISVDYDRLLSALSIARPDPV